MHNLHIFHHLLHLEQPTFGYYLSMAIFGALTLKNHEV